jgi:hypothetical protein
MALDGEIELDVNIDKEEDTVFTLELLPPTNSARLGQEKFANVTVLGKGHFDEVSLSIPQPNLIRGQGMSPCIVNLTRKIRVHPPQASVVLFETIDGTAKASENNYSMLKKGK